MPLFVAPWGRIALTGITANGIYTVVTVYAKQVGIEVAGSRATATTSAPEHAADTVKVQARLGHANISTTKIYDRRQIRPEDLPTHKVNYLCAHTTTPLCASDMALSFVQNSLSTLPYRDFAKQFGQLFHGVGLVQQLETIGPILGQYMAVAGG